MSIYWCCNCMDVDDADDERESEWIKLKTIIIGRISDGFRISVRFALFFLHSSPKNVGNGSQQRSIYSHYVSTLQRRPRRLCSHLERVRFFFPID